MSELLPAISRQWELACPDPAAVERLREAIGISARLAGLLVSRGTALAHTMVERYGKPLLVVDLSAANAAHRALGWLQPQHRDRTAAFALGIGGPRESEAPGIYRRAKTFLRALLSELAKAS